MMKNFKRAVALSMSAVMVFSFAGCGKGKDKQSSKTEESDNSKYGYQVEYKDITSPEELKTKNVTFSSYNVYDDTLYYTMYAYDDKTGKSTCYVCDTPVKDPSSAKLLATYEGPENGYKDVRYIYPWDDGSVTLFVYESVFNGDKTELYNNTSGIDLGDIPGDAIITEEYLNTLGIHLENVGLEFSDVSGMTVSEVVSLYESLSGDDPDDSYEQQTITLVTLDKDGNETATKDMTNEMKDFFPQNYARGKDDKLYMNIE